MQGPGLIIDNPCQWTRDRAPGRKVKDGPDGTHLWVGELQVAGAEAGRGEVRVREVSELNLSPKKTGSTRIHTQNTRARSQAVQDMINNSRRV